MSFHDLYYILSSNTIKCFKIWLIRYSNSSYHNVKWLCRSAYKNAYESWKNFTTVTNFYLKFYSFSVRKNLCRLSNDYFANDKKNKYTKLRIFLKRLPLSYMNAVLHTRVVNLWLDKLVSAPIFKKSKRNLNAQLFIQAIFQITKFFSVFRHGSTFDLLRERNSYPAQGRSFVIGFAVCLTQSWKLWYLIHLQKNDLKIFNLKHSSRRHWMCL